MKKALITGITGQDGYFLSQLLDEKGYEVHGIVRHSINGELGNLSKLPLKIKEKIIIHYGDITDSGFISGVISDNNFNEIYHLAAQSFVKYSFTNPKSTYDININGTLNILEGITNYSKDTKLYFAGTSELFGKVATPIQNEETPFHPRSPYGISKLAGFWSVKHYREAYNIFTCSGILFNHESEVRGDEFVTQKIIKHLVDGKLLELGNLDAKRDWGYAKDYVYGMWLMLQQEKPDDYILATGKTYSVRQFIEYTCKALGTQIRWMKGDKPTDEVGLVNGKVVVKINTDYYRPCEVELLCGDNSKAKKELNWFPEINLEQLISIMVNSAIKRK